MAKVRKKTFVAETAKGKRITFQFLGDAPSIVKHTIVLFETAYRASRGDKPKYYPEEAFTRRAKKHFTRLLLQSTERALKQITIPFPPPGFDETVKEHGRLAWKMVKYEKTGRYVNLEQVMETLDMVKAKRCPSGNRGLTDLKPAGFVCDF